MVRLIGMGLCRWNLVWTNMLWLPIYVHKYLYKEKLKTVVRDLLMRALLNRHQTPQIPGMPTVECSKGIDLCK